MSQSVSDIEAEFNIWALQQKICIERTDYFVQKRVNSKGLEYEEMVLFVFYSLITKKDV
jgi:hypothetical protein